MSIELSLRVVIMLVAMLVAMAVEVRDLRSWRGLPTHTYLERSVYLGPWRILRFPEKDLGET